jgi:hypothetical protein
MFATNQIAAVMIRIWHRDVLTSLKKFDIKFFKFIIVLSCQSKFVPTKMLVSLVVSAIVAAAWINLTGARTPVQYYYCSKKSATGELRCVPCFREGENRCLLCIRLYNSRAECEVFCHILADAPDVTCSQLPNPNTLPGSPNADPEAGVNADPTGTSRNFLCPSTYDIVIILDGAASPENFYAMKLNAIAVLNTAPRWLRLRIAVLQTSHQQFAPDFDLDAYNTTAAARVALKNVRQYPGPHYGAEALRYGYKMLPHNMGIIRASVIYYFASTPSQTNATLIASQIRRSTFRFRIVGVGLDGWEGQRAREYLKGLTGGKNIYYEIPGVTKFFC